MHTRCAVCQGEDGAIEHVVSPVLRCTGLPPALPKGGADLAGAVGFADKNG